MLFAAALVLTCGAVSRLVALAPASLAAAENYTAHAGLNCYQGHGGVNIDSGAAPGALTLDACLAHCDSTPACECVVRGAGDKATQCWRRSACDPAECLPEASMDTYIKPGDAPSAKCEAAMEQLMAEELAKLGLDATRQEQEKALFDQLFTRLREKYADRVAVFEERLGALGTN